jgi:acetyltransferase-like isoleucine patch superfamily enzyme
VLRNVLVELPQVIRPMSSRETASLVYRAGAKLQTALWPEFRATLRRPIACDPPAIHEFAAFGEGSWVVPPAVVSGAGFIHIGAGVAVMEHSDLRAEAPISLGDGSWFARFSTIWASVGVQIGKEVMTSDYVTVVDCWHRPGNADMAHAPKGAPVVIGDGAYLGCSCIVGPGVTIGEGAFIGEGAVVLGDVPAHSVVYGNPARVTKHLTQANVWQGDMFGETA